MAMDVPGYKMQYGGWLVPDSELPDCYTNIPTEGKNFGTDRVNINTGVVETHFKVLDWEYDQLVVMKKGPPPENPCWKISYPKLEGYHAAGVGYTMDRRIAHTLKEYADRFGFEVSEPLPHYPGYDAQNRDAFDWQSMWLVDVGENLAPGLWGKMWYFSLDGYHQHDWTTIGLFWAYGYFSNYYKQYIRPMIDQNDALYFGLMGLMVSPVIQNRLRRRANDVGPGAYRVSNDGRTEVQDSSSSSDRNDWYRSGCRTT